MPRGRGLKEDNSLGALGVTSVAVDPYTKERLKKISGDKPVSQFLRDWSQAVLDGKTTLPGTGKLTAPLHTTQGDFAELKGEFLKFTKAMLVAVGMASGALDLPDEIWTGNYSGNQIYDMVMEAKNKQKAEVKARGTAQGELKFTD